MKCGREMEAWFDSFYVTYLLTYLLYLFTYLLTYLPTYLLTHSLTPCSRFLLEKQTNSQLLKNFPSYDGTQRFITAFTSTCHLPLF